MTSQAMILANALLTKRRKKKVEYLVSPSTESVGGRKGEGVARKVGKRQKNLHPVICSEDGNEHGNVYDQRTGFGSEDIDYPAEPPSECKRLINPTSTTYIHKTIPPPNPKFHQPLLSLPFFLQLTTNKNPTTDDPKYPAPKVMTADALQNACANVGIAYGCLGILGVCRMRPMIWVAPPSLGSIQILTT